MPTSLLSNELLEDIAPTPKTPETPKDVPENKETPSNPDLEELKGNVVADKKLDELEHKNNPKASDILASDGKNLLAFLKTGEDKEKVESLVDRLEGIFTKVGESYCKLTANEARHFATGIVCSMIDSLTSEVNGGKTASDAGKSNEKDKQPTSIDARGAVAKNVSKLLGGKDAGEGIDNALSGVFDQRSAVFGVSDVLRQRLKSIFLLIELTRKSREVLCPRDANGKPDPKKSACTRDLSIVNNPKLFVGSSRIIETAIKADKDIIKPENIHTLKDFQQAIKLTQGSSSSEYGLLDLLGLREQTVPLANPIATQEYFADLKSEVLTGSKAKETASKVLSALAISDEQGEHLQSMRSAHSAILETGGLRGQIKERMDALAPLSDPNDPDSLYSTFNKFINLVCGLLTGTSFTEEAYDPNAAKLGSLTTDATRTNAEKDALGNDILKSAAVGSVGYHAMNVILKGESLYKYDAINASDSVDGQLSIGLMQWHGERAGRMISKMGALDRTIVTSDENGLGADFGKFVLDDKPNAWWLETQKRGQLDESGKWVPNQFEEDGTTPLAEWKKNRVGSMKKLLGTDLAKQVMNETLKTDIDSYIVVVKKELDIGESNDNLTLEQKKAITMLARFYNAGPERTKKLINTTGKTLDIVKLRDAALADPWNKEKDLTAGVKASINTTYIYCEAMHDNA